MSHAIALEDFFSLTEMKAGISTPARVGELINLMRIEKNKDVNNIGEISRQWCTVAKTIACTENKECLEVFVQLDGLCFVNTWLKDIQKSANDISDGVIEESLVAFLQALEILPVDGEKIASSGVGITLKSLTAHSSFVVKERVHKLLNSWELHMTACKVDADVKEDMSVTGCTNTSIKPNESSLMETSHLNVNDDFKSTGTGHNAGTPDSLYSEKVKDVLNSECSVEVGTVDSLDHGAVKRGNSVTPLSIDLCIVKESVPVTGSVSADADTGFTNTKTESFSNLERKEQEVLLRQNIEVLADVGSGDNGIKSPSNELSNDVEQPSTSCFPETEGSVFKSDDITAEEPATEAAQKDPVMVASDGMGITEPVCKMLDGPTEQVFNSFPQAASSGKEMSSDSVAAKAEDNTDGIELSHPKEVAQEAEVKPRGVLGFDLNEDIISEDFDPAANQGLNCDKVDHQMISSSFISAARFGTVSGLAAGHLQYEGTLGWKGSAATSAFRPASPCKPLEMNNVTSSTSPSNSLKHSPYVPTFDLNMAEDENADNNTNDSIIAVSSSHPSEESCVEIGPTKSKRAQLDLNSIGDAPQSNFWNMNGTPFSQQNVYRSPSPASSSSSVHPSIWDLDLNKKFSVPNLPNDPPQYPGNRTINFMGGHGIKKPAASEISIMGARVDVDREEPIQSQLQPTASGLRNFLTPNMNLSPPLHSLMYRPGIPITMYDPSGSSILPTMIGPAQQPYLMNLMSVPPPQAPTGITSPSYSTFDPNMLYMNDTANRHGPHTRQYLRSTQGNFLEPHLAPIPQPSSFQMKRKEPHSGWDPYLNESPGKS